MSKSCPCRPPDVWNSTVTWDENRSEWMHKGQRTQHTGKVQSCNKSPSGGAQRLQALGCHAMQSVLCPKCCCCSSPGGAEQPHAMPALDPNPAAGYPSPQSTEFLRQALRHTQGHASSNAKLHVAALRACFKSVEHVPYCSNNQEVTLNAEWFPCT